MVNAQENQDVPLSAGISKPSAEVAGARAVSKKHSTPDSGKEHQFV